MGGFGRQGTHAKGWRGLASVKLTLGDGESGLSNARV